MASYVPFGGLNSTIPTFTLSSTLDQLGALTLGDIFRSPHTLALLAQDQLSRSQAGRAALEQPYITILAVLAPVLLFTLSGKEDIRAFKWDIPKEVDREWKGKVIPHPNLAAHERDHDLLPTNADKSRRHLTCYDPSTAYHLDTIPLLTASEVSDQIAKAHASQPAWAASTFAQRRRVLNSLRKWVIRDMEAIVDVACRDTGKTRVDAVFGEVLVTIPKIDWLCKYGEALLSPSPRPTNLLLAHKTSAVHYAPLGVTLACVSWNYSFHNLISPILASLFAGNTCVVKCSEQVAWSSRHYIAAIQSCLKACGHTGDEVQLVVCLPDVADTVTRHPLIRHVTFIGSEVVGRKVAQAAAEIMVPTCIELGGKDPAFLLPSADLEYFGSTWLRGAFQSAGQNCIGIELFLVPSSLHAPFISALLPRVQALRIGTDIGSLISHTPIARLESLLAEAVSQGARILAGGKQYHHPTHPHGAYFEPTLIVDVTMDMRIAQEELFAPVMTVVRYEDDRVDEAVRWVKEGRYGLGASVWGNDRKECRRVAGMMECGMVSINDFGVFYLNQAMPFGGVKASGHGRFGGEEGLRSLTQPKAITEDRFFSWIRTPIPRAVDFPLPAGETSWNFLTGLVGVAFDGGWARVKGLGKVIVNASG